MKTMSRLRSHHFTMGMFGLFHIKMCPAREVAPKCDLPPTELNKMCHCTTIRTEYLQKTSSIEVFFSIECPETNCISLLFVRSQILFIKYTHDFKKTIGKFSFLTEKWSTKCDSFCTNEVYIRS